MAEKLKQNQRLVCVGQTALRGPDGTPLHAVPMYIVVDKSAVDPQSGLVQGEADAQDDIAAVLAPLFKQYMDGVEALEKGMGSKNVVHNKQRWKNNKHGAV